MMLRRISSSCLSSLHRACVYRGRGVCSGQQAHLSVAAVWSSSASGSSSGSGSGGDTAAGGGGVTYVPGYERVRELEQADVNVQKMLSLEYASQREHNKMATADMIEKLQGREGDTGSSHVQIGTLTVRIQYLTEHMKKNRKDKSCLRSLIQLVHRRKKLLLSLKETDNELYQKLIKDLGLREPTVEKYLQKRRKTKK